MTGRTTSTKTTATNENTEDEEEKGIYDSSHKQRVPSWSVYLLVQHYYSIDIGSRCDRILWKFNLEPDPESDSGDEEMTTLCCHIGIE